MDATEIRDALSKAKGPWYPKDHLGGGFYAIYLKQTHDLPFLELADDRLLYVGMTESGFSHRDHFEPRSGHSGGCTFRRSLGAILKHRLDLSAMPRSSASTPVTFTNFRFTPEGEAKLSDWMIGGLYIARVPFESNVGLAEAQLIRALQPPLNLKGWHNPQSELVKRLRCECANEARHHRALQRSVA